MKRLLLAFVFASLFAQHASAGFVVLNSTLWSGNNHTYQLVEFTQGYISWNDANAEVLNAYGAGANLATFTGESEWVFVRDNVLEPFRREFDQGWLGATDSVIEGDWRWVTDEAWSYNAPAVFDNLNNEDYLMAWRFLPNDPLQWNDVNQSTASSNRALIEIVATPEPCSILFAIASTAVVATRLRKRFRKLN